MSRALDGVGVGVDNTDADLPAFVCQGGKIIEYHGQVDPVAPVGDSDACCRNVQARQLLAAKIRGF